jgi:hypothetical protein
MKIKDLRRKIQGLDDETPVVVYAGDHSYQEAVGYIDWLERGEPRDEKLYDPDGDGQVEVLIIQ